MNVLALGAHPLDIVLLCGGTLARYASAGHGVTIACMCGLGSESPETDTDEMSRLRLEESERAAGVIGASLCAFEVPICELHRDPEIRLRLTELLRRVEPHVILTHDPQDYHMDHETTSRLASQCSFLARQYVVQTESPPTRVHATIYHMDTISGLGFEPEVYVDITDVFETKLQMMQCYESEIRAWRDNPVVEWLEWAEVHCRYRGLQTSVRYAEAFRSPHRWGHVLPARLLP